MPFHVYYPPMMILAPAAFVGLWCWWTGVRGLLPMLLATLGVLAGWGVCAWLWGPSPLITNLFALGGFFGVFFGFGLPLVRRSFKDLPEGPRGASLKPRELRLFRGAFVWPYAVWAALTAWMFLAGSLARLAWLGPLLGLVSLLALKPVLRATVMEPEPLGGPDPDGLAAAYARFRQRRTRAMYWLCVSMALFVTASWGAFFGVFWGGAVLGPMVGAFGALFGTWADAQRYLLRRQLSGAAPPR